MSLSKWPALPPQRTGELSYLDHLYRLYLSLVQRMRLIFYLMEVYVKKVDAADIAVPCGPVIEFH